jgi:hypothetical protein
MGITRVAVARAVSIAVAVIGTSQRCSDQCAGSKAETDAAPSPTAPAATPTPPCGLCRIGQRWDRCSDQRRRQGSGSYFRYSHHRSRPGASRLRDSHTVLRGYFDFNQRAPTRKPQAKALPQPWYLSSTVWICSSCRSSKLMSAMTQSGHRAIISVKRTGGHLSAIGPSDQPSPLRGVTLIL